MAIGVNARTAFSLLFPPIIDEFGWDRGVVAGVFSFGFFVSAFFAPFVGRLMDRRGPALVVEIGVIADRARARASRRSRASRGSSTRRSASWSATAANFLGYGVQSQFIPHWFVRRRGLAIGIAFSGVGIGSIVLLPWLQLLIARDGWRSPAVALALITAVVLVPLNLLLRKRPQDIGLHPDGDAAPADVARADRPANIVDPAWAATRLDARARAAHGALLVDRARLLRRGSTPGTPCRCTRPSTSTEIGVSPIEAAWALGLVSLARRSGRRSSSATCRTASAANGSGRSAASASSSAARR